VEHDALSEQRVCASLGGERYFHHDTLGRAGRCSPVCRFAVVRSRYIVPLMSRVGASTLPTDPVSVLGWRRNETETPPRSPRRTLDQPMPYAGGMARYREICSDVAANNWISLS
jgi:hypothetical protein